MLEIIYSLLLSGLFFLMSRRERKFQMNKNRYIDEARVFLQEDETSEVQG